MRTYLIIAIATASALSLAACGGSAGSGSGGGGSGGGTSSLAGGPACMSVYHFTGDIEGTKVDQAYCFREQSVIGGVQAWLMHGDFYVDADVSQRTRLSLLLWGAGAYTDTGENTPLSGSIEIVGSSAAPRTFYCPGAGSSVTLAQSSSASTAIALNDLSKLGTCPGGGSPSTDSLTITSHVVIGGASGSSVVGTLGGIAIQSTLNSIVCQENDCGMTFKIGGKYAKIQIKLHDTLLDGNASTFADEFEFAYPFDTGLTKDKVLYYCGSAASTVVTSATASSGDTTIKLSGLGALGTCPGTPVSGSLVGKE